MINRKHRTQSNKGNHEHNHLIRTSSIKNRLLKHKAFVKTRKKTVYPFRNRQKTTPFTHYTLQNQSKII